METNYISSIQPYLLELEQLQPIPTGVEPSLSPFPTKVVIFDIYGTLIISASGDVDKAKYSSSMIKKALEGGRFQILVDTEDAFNEIYSDFNAYLFGHLSSTRRAGKPYPEVNVVEVWQDTLIAAEKKGKILITEHSDIYLFTFIFELESNPVWPMPDLKEVVHGLNEKGITLGIVSNAQFYTPVLMNYLLNDSIEQRYDITPFDKELSVFSYQELRGKPDTFLFEKLVPKLKSRNVLPEEVIYVGNDMLKDVTTAGKVGFKTVLFAGDERSYRLHKNDKRVEGVRPDFVITELKQLFSILNLT